MEHGHRDQIPSGLKWDDFTGDLPTIQLLNELVLTENGRLTLEQRIEITNHRPDYVDIFGTKLQYGDMLYIQWNPLPSDRFPSWAIYELVYDAHKYSPSPVLIKRSGHPQCGYNWSALAKLPYNEKTSYHEQFHWLKIGDHTTPMEWLEHKARSTYALADYHLSAK